jgi:hypothetical protein
VALLAPEEIPGGGLAAARTTPEHDAPLAVLLHVSTIVYPRCQATSTNASP